MGDRDWARRAIPSANSCESENGYAQGSPANCHLLAMTLRKALISLELRLAHFKLSKVVGAVRPGIALERAEVRR